LQRPDASGVRTDDARHNGQRGYRLSNALFAEIDRVVDAGMWAVAGLRNGTKEMKAIGAGNPFPSKDLENPALTAAAIKEEALRFGFDGCGISRAEALDEDAARLQKWLDRGYHASMAYMGRHAHKRVDPTRLFEGARSVISVLLNYYPSGTQTDPRAPVLAKYAYGKDYHTVVREKLNRLLEWILSGSAPVHGRAFVDTAPLLEKAWAARAGLGWIGKNTCLISPGKGSFCFIGTLLSISPCNTTTPLTIYAAIARSASTPAPRRRLSPRERWMQAAAFPIGRSRTRRPSERHSGIVWPIGCSAVISARMSAPGTATPFRTVKKTLTPRLDCWK